MSGRNAKLSGILMQLESSTRIEPESLQIILRDSDLERLQVGDRLQAEISHLKVSIERGAPEVYGL